VSSLTQQNYSDFAEFRESSELLDDAEKLRQRMADEGYLFFRKLLPTDVLLELREKITSVLVSQGWIRGGSQQMDAIASSLPYREGDAGYLQALKEVVRLEALHALAHRPELIQVMSKVLGGSAFPHPLSITRLIFPHAPELSTPPHQDYPNNQGTSNLTATWIPLGDCPRETGSLAILEGSNRFGLLPLQFHLGPGNRAAVLDERINQCRWVSSDFALGDVLLFPALTVHRALDNLSEDRLRLSVDFRYQVEGEELTPGCLKPHFECLEWEEIYRGWNNEDLKYYWREKRYKEVPWQEKMHEIAGDHFDEAVRQEIIFGKKVRKRYQQHLPDVDTD
jgi:ectoine hydroxylase-related dioxygenase (phytanoyl-CoA dioxygenase family)